MNKKHELFSNTKRKIDKKKLTSVFPFLLNEKILNILMETEFAI